MKDCNANINFEKNVLGNQVLSESPSHSINNARFIYKPRHEINTFTMTI